MTSRSKKPAKWITILFQVACLNFALFFAVALLLGGSAANGQSENGHYFVGNHGKLTEVSLATFTYSLIHTYLSIALILVSVVLMGFSAGSKGLKRQRVSRGTNRNI